MLGSRRGEGAVDDQLDSFKGPRLGSTIAGIADGVATNGDAGLVGFCFCWTHLADNAGVCDIPLAVDRYILEFDGRWIIFLDSPTHVRKHRLFKWKKIARYST